MSKTLSVVLASDEGTNEYEVELTHSQSWLITTTYENLKAIAGYLKDKNYKNYGNSFPTVRWIFKCDAIEQTNRLQSVSLFLCMNSCCS